jgi:hypothetical protein
MITMYRNKKRSPSFAHFAKEEIPNRVISARDAIDGWTALSSQGIASWARLTGYVELEYVWPWNALCASVENVDVAHSVIFSSGFHVSVAGASNATGHPAALKHQVLMNKWRSGSVDRKAQDLRENSSPLPF